MKILVFCGATTAATVFGAAPARAEWLPGASRAISLGDSASPHAPVTSYAYGPSAQASLGGDWALLRWRSHDTDVRLGGSALVSFESADKRRIGPDQLQRRAFELGLAWALTEGTSRTLEWGVALGHRSASTLDAFVLRDPYRPNAVPFGAGGNYLGLDLGWQAVLSQRWLFTSRWGLRLFANSFPDLVGQTEASDVIADTAREGSEFECSSEIGVRWAASAQVQPVARLYLDAIEPHDDQAKKLWLGRLLFGAAFPGRLLELSPFVTVEAGHGEGLLVNRTELRLATGVRLYAR